MSAHDPPSAVVDSDIVETREWIESFDALIHAQDSTRALFLLRRLHRRKVLLRQPYRDCPYRTVLIV
jgi:pyruvate dehydrogenase complex dehydrogenase (E1) component